MTSSAPPHIDDAGRLAALDSYVILDTPPEQGFDDIVQLACRACGAPVALVSLVADDRQWFKARVGFPSCETGIDSSVCAHALAQPDRMLVIPDLTADPRTVANPLVTGDPFLRFYAGAPLVTPGGEVLGTLCVLDHHARPDGLTAPQSDDLRALARQVMSQLELRRAVANRDAARREERQAFQAREALGTAQAAVAHAGGDLDAILQAIVRGAMRTVPAAEGGVVELVDGADLEYRATAGTLARHIGVRLPIADSFSGHCASSGLPQMMGDSDVDRHVHRTLVERPGLRSAIATPVLRGAAVVGVLKLQSSLPQAFDERDLDLIGLFAGLATTGLAAAEARALASAKDVYWRGLFHRLSEGFIVGDVVRDRAGHITDWRYVEVNPAWGTLVGVAPSTVIGRTIREVLPGIEDEWVDEFARVVETGQPVAFTRQVGTLHRWYDGRAFPFEGDRFGVLFLEATDRIEAEARQAALLALGDRLRDLATVEEMTAAAAEIVGRTLGVARAGFGRIGGDVETLDIEPDWAVPGVASIAGHHRFDDYGDIRGHLRRGEALVVDDVTTDHRTRSDPSPLQALGIGALVDMPVRERGRTVAMFFVHDAKARTWTPEELAFLRNVADRVEVGVARLHAESQQAVLNREMAHRLKNTLAVVQSIATQTLRGVPDRKPVLALDRRILALSRAHDVLMHRNWSAAQIRPVMEGVLTLQAELDRFTLDGPDMDITADAAMSLSLLLHELATNATKYGALSIDAGSVRVAWRIEDATEPAFVLDWTESGGPPVAPPSGSTGFGSKLIRMGLLGTRAADLRYLATGLRAEFNAPLASFETRTP